MITKRKLDRADATRERLLDAAIDVFGTHGFHGATTRMLTEAAGVNQQAIPYHFGSKEGLYIAAAEHLGAMIAHKVAIPREAIVARFARMDEGGPTLTKQEARQLLTMALQAFAELMINDQSEAWARFIVREQMAPTEAFERIYGAVMGPILRIMTRLVGIIFNEAPTNQHVRLRTLSLIGSVMVFRMARAAAMRVLEWDQTGAAETALLRAHVADLVATLTPGAAR